MGDTSFLNEIAGAANARSTYQDLLDFTDKQINNWADYILNDIKNAIRAKVNKGEFSVSGGKKVVSGGVYGSMSAKLPNTIASELNSDEESRFNSRDKEIYLKYSTLEFKLKAQPIEEWIDCLVDKNFLFFHWTKKKSKKILRPYIYGTTQKVLLELRDKAKKEGIELTISCSYSDFYHGVGSIEFDDFIELSDEGLKNHPEIKYWWDDFSGKGSAIDALKSLANYSSYKNSKKYFTVEIGYKMEF